MTNKGHVLIAKSDVATLMRIISLGSLMPNDDLEKGIQILETVLKTPTIYMDKTPEPETFEIVQLDLTDEELIKISLAAHTAGVTLNDYIVDQTVKYAETILDEDANKKQSEK